MGTVFPFNFHSILNGSMAPRTQIYSQLGSEAPWCGLISYRGTGWLALTSGGSLRPVTSPPWPQLSHLQTGCLPLKITETLLHTITPSRGKAGHGYGFSPRGLGAQGGLRFRGTAPAWCRFCSPGRGSQLHPGHLSARGCPSAARQKLAQREAMRLLTGAAPVSDCSESSPQPQGDMGNGPQACRMMWDVLGSWGE